jgi:flagellar capping protein FliD
VHSLSDLGIAFDAKGVASFDQTAFQNLSGVQLEDTFTFLGSATAGLGGRSKTLTDISESVTGLAQIQLDNYERTNKRLTAEISVLTERATAMQGTLAAQLHVADALLASLQSSQNMLTATIQSLNYSTYGKTTG